MSFFCQDCRADLLWLASLWCVVILACIALAAVWVTIPKRPKTPEMPKARIERDPLTGRWKRA